MRAKLKKTKRLEQPVKRFSKKISKIVWEHCKDVYEKVLKDSLCYGASGVHFSPDALGDTLIKHITQDEVKKLLSVEN